MSFSSIKPKTDLPFKQLALPKIIYKFGGSSLANGKCYRKVANIVGRHLNANDLVVVSASGQTTDWLSQICDQPEQAPHALIKLRYHHQNIIEDCVGRQKGQKLQSIIDNAIHWIERLLRLDQLEQFRNEILALGELWSAQILCALLEQQEIKASWIDARQFLKLQWQNDGFEVDQQASQSYLFEHLKSRQHRISVVTGFIASDCENRTITLGRNGSDYTATLLANLCDTEEVCIWTDVAGIYDFDPNLADDAKPIARLNQQLIQKLSNLGSPVLHSKTLKPLANRRCQLSIRSTFAPELSGSRICQSNSFHQNAIVTHKNHLTKLSVKGSSEIACQRLINDVQTHADKVTSEFLLCIKSGANQFDIVIDHSRTNYWQQWLNKAKQSQSYIIAIGEPLSCSLLALVTEDIDHRPYHKYFFCNFIDKLDNHSGIIRHNNAYLCLFDNTQIDNQALTCFRQWQHYRNLRAIFLLGTGNVGETWLTQWQKLDHEDEAVVLSANSKTITLLCNNESIHQEDNSIEQLKKYIQQAPFVHKVVIDATASEAIAECYAWILTQEIHLISANKLASSSHETQYRKLQSLAKKHQVLWRQNATIGAGLPINHTLSDLVDCGDRILRIRGVFSGTLSWLLQNYNGKQSLTQLIQKAQQHGYSEPDPRIDLSGQDVVRKLVIAARLGGFTIEPDDIACLPLVNPKLMDKDLGYFWQHSNTINDEFHSRWLAAKKRSKTLVYQAEFSVDHGARCGLIEVDFNDPLAQISPCDNIFVIETNWYQNNPLIIRGPGAGKEVTAAAVQSDLNAITRFLSNHTLGTLN